MTPYLTALAAEWATLPSTDTTAQKLAAINAMTIAGPPQDVNATAVVGYLALQGKLAALKTYASPPATASGLAAAEFFALLSVPSFKSFEMSNAAVYTAVSNWLNAWAGDANTGITTADVTAILALAATTVPWWQSVGGTSPVSENDLTAAGGLT